MRQQADAPALAGEVQARLTRAHGYTISVHTVANVTVTLDDALLARARREADRAGKSLSRYLADLIAAEDERLRAESVATMEAFLAHQVVSPEPWTFDRDEIYDRPYPGGHQSDPLEPRRPVSAKAEPLRGVAEPPRRDPDVGGQPASRGRTSDRRAKKARRKPG
jgi:hypothetical protein